MGSGCLVMRMWARPRPSARHERRGPPPCPRARRCRPALSQLRLDEAEGLSLERGARPQVVLEQTVRDAVTEDSMYVMADVEESSDWRIAKPLPQRLHRVQMLQVEHAAAQRANAHMPAPKLSAICCDRHAAEIRRTEREIGLQPGTPLLTSTLRQMPS